MCSHDRSLNQKGTVLTFHGSFVILFQLLIDPRALAWLVTVHGGLIHELALFKDRVVAARRCDPYGVYPMYMEIIP